MMSESKEEQYRRGVPMSQWDPRERPRERLLKLGAEGLSNAELLAVILGSGTARIDVMGLAHRVLEHFESLSNLTHANLDELLSVSGIGPARGARILSGFEIAHRALYEKACNNDQIASPEDSKKYLMARLKDKKREVFACIYLDSKHCAVAYEELFHGTLDSASVHPREVVRSGLKHGAAAVILAHNHPSGKTRPSEADIRITKKLQAALELVQIKVLDHFIVGKGEAMSFKTEGML